MSSRTSRELLEELRAYLLHFEQSGHIGDDAVVAEIKRRLCVRIAEVEAALKLSTGNQSRTGAMVPNARNPIDRP